MKKLTKQHIADRDKIASDLKADFENLERAVEDYNSAVTKAHMELCAMAEKYNEHIDAANEWMGGVHDDIQCYIDDRSEKSPTF